MSGLNNKKYLDETGLVALWGRITDYGAPRWTAYKPTAVGATETIVSIGFESAATDEQKAENKGLDTVIQIPEATLTNAGVLSAADKYRVNNIEVFAEDLITIKNIKVGQNDESGNNANIRKLNIDGNKNINWDFVYNSSTDTLDIIDVNASGKVMTSVAINDFIGDALLKGILTDSDIVTEDGDGNSGEFIKLTFTTTTNDGTTESKDIYINVADLIDLYLPGSGISINQGGLIVDGQRRESYISLKTAGTDITLDEFNQHKGIGGFVAHKVSDVVAVEGTEIEKRYFGVEIGKDDKAIVNVPIGTLTSGENSIENEITISPAIVNTQDIITGIDIYENDDNTGHYIQPTGVTLTFDKETDITTDGDAGIDGSTLKFGDSFTVFKDITPGGINGHRLTKSNTTWTLPQLSKVSASNTEAEVQTIVADLSASSFSFTAMTDINVNPITGAIQPVTQKFTAKVDVLSIPITDITGLKYPEA